ncbi:MAG: hypothetical protein ACU0C9_14440, partial [Paracoccaceae bacterium]
PVQFAAPGLSRNHADVAFGPDHAHPDRKLPPNASDVARLVTESRPVPPPAAAATYTDAPLAKVANPEMPPSKIPLHPVQFAAPGLSRNHADVAVGPDHAPPDRKLPPRVNKTGDSHPAPRQENSASAIVVRETPVKPTHIEQVFNVVPELLVRETDVQYCFTARDANPVGAKFRNRADGRPDNCPGRSCAKRSPG